MKVGSLFIRNLFALWLCIGTQMHFAVDHAAMFQHAAHSIGHSHEPHAALEHDHAHDHDGEHHVHASIDLAHVAAAPHPDTLCCIETPQHRHHGSGAPHTHLTEALLASSSQRNLPFLDAAIVPIRLIDSLPKTAPSLPVVSVALPSEPPASHNAALRGPPLA